MHPRAKHQDLAIISIDPLLAHQVTFEAIRGAVTDFLNERAIDFTNRQPTHLGQSYIKFKHAYTEIR